MLIWSTGVYPPSHTASKCKRKKFIACSEVLKSVCHNPVSYFVFLLPLDKYCNCWRYTRLDGKSSNLRRREHPSHSVILVPLCSENSPLLDAIWTMNVQFLQQPLEWSGVLRGWLRLGMSKKMHDFQLGVFLPLIFLVSSEQPLNASNWDVNVGEKSDL